MDRLRTPAPLRRVALVGPLPPPAGGMANQTAQLAQLLRAEGIDVDVVQVNAPYRPAWVGRVRGVRALLRLVPYLISLWRAARRAQLLHVMANSGWSWHLFAAPAIWIGRLSGCPVLVNYRGGDADSFLRRTRRWVTPSLLRADVLVVPSGFLLEVFARHGFGARIVPNVVSLERFAPCLQARALGPTILVARHLEAIYDNATALRAFALVAAVMPAARMVIAGMGPQRAALERLATELGIAASVRFAGNVERQAMPALYQAADVVLNPSTVDNTPNSVLEALASGVPVVSTDVGGIPYLVAHECTALLVPPRAPQAMADALLRLLREPRLAQALRAAGIDHVRQFGWAAVKPLLLRSYGALARPAP
ncbi:MAG: glycosyltransferase family 4 protein [Pseudomonadota bacterium]